MINSRKSTEKLNLLILGTGMYVCGRGTDGYGTVLPAVLQTYSAGHLDTVSVAGKDGQHLEAFENKLNELRQSLDIHMPYTPYPQRGETDPEAYKRALAALPDPAAVIIVTPDHLHTEMALTAIGHKKHVLVVKPLAPTVGEGRSLIRAAEEANVYGAVEFHKRWDLANLKLRDMLRRRCIGDPLYFHVEYSQRKFVPARAFTAWIEHTNIFQYLGVHYADIISFVTGDVPRRIMAVGQRGWLTEHGIQTHDAIQVFIEWSQGFVSTFLTNWIDSEHSSAMSNQSIKVIGTQGRIESEQTDRGTSLVTDSGGLEHVNPYFCQSYYDAESGHVRYCGYGIESIRQFLLDVGMIANGHCQPNDFEGVRPTFRDALPSTAIVEGANLSLANGGEWVVFDDKLQPHLK